VCELLEHQAGQQLGLSELLGAELVAMRRSGLAGGFVGDLQNPARRFACLHISYYMASSGQVRWISTEQVSVHFFTRKSEPTPILLPDTNPAPEELDRVGYLIGGCDPMITAITL
jgi:hypothetical protein